ncbi:hypothetical protein [Streptomyces sp. NBC_01304]|uniref:hypothetical protein n=1 Tax=Streptomyces sp. NBC_01304 TaxID=2903818 RepID=UPI002E107DF8|nr:hypothetical protein OG430_44490 [Streptomyces sp. NBC_01304]
MSNPYQRFHEQAADDPRVTADVFALIHPEGHVTFEQGTAYGVATVVDPHHGAISGFMLYDATGRAVMRGYGADVALAMPEKYAPNPLAERIIPMLGGPVQPWRGHVALFAWNGVDEARGLNAEQQERIRAVAGEQP